MKLRTKEGHVELTLIDSHGSEHTIDPSNDPYIIHNQETLFTKPHKLILYVGRLKQVFEAAGNPLRSVTASSCFSLNRRPHRHLYVQGVDLLPFVGASCCRCSPSLHQPRAAAPGLPLPPYA